jgi:hypothetical protein
MSVPLNVITLGQAIKKKSNDNMSVKCHKQAEIQLLMLVIHLILNKKTSVNS